MPGNRQGTRSFKPYQTKKGGIIMPEEKKAVNPVDKKKELTDEEKEKLMMDAFEQLDGCEGCPGCCHE